MLKVLQIAQAEVGTATEKAVRKFQEAYYLAVDGEAGHETWGRLIAKN